MDGFGLIVGWVGILAFFLAIPMAVAANLLTPTVASIWARTSSSRRQKRIEKLQRNLSQANVLINDSALRADYMARGLRLIAVSAIGFLYLLCFVVAEALTIHAHLVGITKSLHGAELDTFNFGLWKVLYLALYLITFYNLVRAMKAFEVSSRFHLNSIKNKIERELKKLCG